MKIKYFHEIDTLPIEFNKGVITEMRDLDENMLPDVDADADADGNICGMTIEHSKQRADIPHFSFEQIAA